MEVGWETLRQEAAPPGPLAAQLHFHSVSDLQAPTVCQALNNGATRSPVILELAAWGEADEKWPLETSRAGWTADAEKGDGESRPGLTGRQAVPPERGGGAEIHGGWARGRVHPWGSSERVRDSRQCPWGV